MSRPQIAKYVMVTSTIVFVLAAIGLLIGGQATDVRMFCNTIGIGSGVGFLLGLTIKYVKPPE